ncbi:uncharacterized protein DFL_005707 [Arthrobotrys flagrans]|uniref:Uncharacterized protein n=1 Tax=Arthrobotrys flagrans TaxID=97331 RepID=A0A436ZYW0_ARTFL|nr:hypothetical protein DFL_005707 [Arthrobotrys flagrans]
MNHSHPKDTPEIVDCCIFKKGALRKEGASETQRMGRAELHRASDEPAEIPHTSVPAAPTEPFRLTVQPEKISHKTLILPSHQQRPSSLHLTNILRPLLSSFGHAGNRLFKPRYLLPPLQSFRRQLASITHSFKMSEELTHPTIVDGYILLCYR